MVPCTRYELDEALARALARALVAAVRREERSAALVADRPTAPQDMPARAPFAARIGSR